MLTTTPQERARRAQHARDLAAIVRQVDAYDITPPTCTGLLVELCGMDDTEAHRYADMLFATRERSIT